VTLGPLVWIATGSFEKTIRQKNELKTKNHPLKFRDIRVPARCNIGSLPNSKLARELETTRGRLQRIGQGRYKSLHDQRTTILFCLLVKTQTAFEIRMRLT
jgi:hypothetical protein